MSPALWEHVQEDLKSKIDGESYSAWFGQVEIEERKNTLILWVPTLFHKDWIDNHYKEGITATACRFIGQTTKVKVMCKLDGSKSRAATKSKKTGKRGPLYAANAPFLNQLYTFDAFVVGKSNTFANAACLAVAEAPARVYNPLFIYGRSGLGKTHLIQAIGHYVLRKNPESKVVYLSAEQFTNEFVNAVKDGKMALFQKKYRGADLLLIDDIQFLARKDRSQEEFFHTFNELYESSRQLVISSDKPPKEIPTVEDRLRTRLEWGLLADIQPPDFELRIAILRKKAEEADIDVPDDCIEFIATHVRANIRELEGALMRVGAMATFANRVITIDQTREALRDITSSHRDSRISTEQIQKTVSDYFKVTPQELKGKRRSSDVTLPRQVAMYLCREITGMSLPCIGKEFGGRDHTTVLHSCKKIGGLMERDRHIQTIMNDIRANLQK